MEREEADLDQRHSRNAPGLDGGGQAIVGSSAGMVYDFMYERTSKDECDKPVRACGPDDCYHSFTQIYTFV